MKTLIEMLVLQVADAVASLWPDRSWRRRDPARDGWPTLAFTRLRSSRTTANLRSSSLHRKAFRRFLHIKRPTP